MAPEVDPLDSDFNCANAQPFSKSNDSVSEDLGDGPVGGTSTYLREPENVLGRPLTEQEQGVPSLSCSASEKLSREERRQQKELRRENRKRKRELKEERRKRRMEKNGVEVPADVTSFSSGLDGRRTLGVCDGVEQSVTLERLKLNISGYTNGLAKKTVMTLPLAADTERLSASGVLDFRDMMVLKSDYVSRPLIVCPTGHIYIEMTSPVHKPAADFLAMIAEPVSRPENIHEFQITVFSLYAAIGVGMTVDSIIQNLNKFSKNEVPDPLERMLRAHGNAFGRVKLVLRENRYFLESSTREDLEYMLTHPIVAEARIRNSMVMREVRGYFTSFFRVLGAYILMQIRGAALFNASNSVKVSPTTQMPDIAASRSNAE